MPDAISPPTSPLNRRFVTPGTEDLVAVTGDGKILFYRQRMTILLSTLPGSKKTLSYLEHVGSFLFN
jgi:hypothetical protein